ncbi:MAG: class I adenylate-forming enzyme family protein [Methanoregula sp.]|jgi:long-chain acyl-CoA synthetase|uniref:class I adenylate-forming enzyme family protein n=1 Tax=Methanoregula sp. TaxID=2052170 RepID=UPI003D0FB781
MEKTGEVLRETFDRNWTEPFLFDAVRGRTLTYGDFFGSVLNCREALEAQGIRKGDRVCLILDNSLELAILYFTAIAMGTVAVPVDPHKGEVEIGDILSQVRDRRVIADSAGRAGTYAGVLIDTISQAFYRPRPAARQELAVFGTLDYDALMLITFTSGSTGVPKGVMHSCNNLVQCALAFRERFSLGPGSVFYHNLPMTYMAGILNLLILPFVAGAKVVIDGRFSVSRVLRFWEVPRKYGANTFWFIPTIVILLLEMDRDAAAREYFTDTPVLAFVGTAPLSPGIGEKFDEKYGIRLYPSYGLSETLFVATTHPAADSPDDSVGPVLDAVSLAFADDDEILICVPWMFRGYYNADTAPFFVDGYFRSGDFGRFDDRGMLKITGRKKDLIIRGGINISPRRIEDYLYRTGTFRDCIVLGLKNYSLGEKTGCFYVAATPLPNEHRQEINRAIARDLGRDYAIDEFIRLDAVPKNLNGKVDKQKILEIYAGTAP